MSRDFINLHSRVRLAPSLFRQSKNEFVKGKSGKGKANYDVIHDFQIDLLQMTNRLSASLLKSQGEGEGNHYVTKRSTALRVLEYLMSILEDLDLH